jgi:hypothetical protein
LVALNVEAANALDVSALDRLRRERQRLSMELSALRELAADRPLTAAEARSWRALRAAWQEVTAELTRKLDTVAPRGPDDRRQGTDRRRGERRDKEEQVEDTDRRSGLQRRRRHRRNGADRREPSTDDVD